MDVETGDNDDKEEKWKEMDHNVMTQDGEEKKQPNLFSKVKESFALKSKKEDKDKEVHQKQKDSDNETQTIEKNKYEEEEEKENATNFLRNFCCFSCRKKKLQSVKPKVSSNDGESQDNMLEEETKNVSKLSTAEDLKPISNYPKEEKETIIASSPISSSGRPPLPATRRHPASASCTMSRPVTELDIALKQFRLSTAASRENLRNSRLDISQMEQQVKTMMTSRPSTPTMGGWRSRAQTENNSSREQWSKLSASLTDLR